MPYVAPISDMRFILTAVAGFDPDAAEGMDADLLDTLLGEAGRFAAEVIAPLDRVGDKVGARLENGAVRMPPGFREGYTAWREAGWNTVDMPSAYGGMGLPSAVETALMEMWISACMALSLSPTLTQGAAEALAEHGDDALKAAYLPKLVSGEWTGAMALTEPEAGSDLGAVHSRAVKQADGSYRLTGRKIFITYGDHDLTDNIIHLVLARLPDAPQRSAGLSMFLVPKVLPDGARNEVVCTGLEEKLGIHASPTCSMAFGDKDGAVAWLVGEENQGLANMFTMMNRARLNTGLQGVAIAERATQTALAYARERRQGGRAIIEHPDVRRMLMDMRSATLAVRAIAYSAAVALDAGRAERAALLTPIVKAFCTDAGVQIASMGVQVHGGMGYVEETGAAQLLRDARIAPIYEGTNGIQAIDLVNRKVAGDQGAAATALIAELRQIPGDAILTEAVEALAQATDWIVQAEPVERLGGASRYLRLFGLTLGGALLEKGAAAPGAPPGFALAARHYAVTRLVQAQGLARTVMAGDSTLSDPDAFAAYG